MSELLFEAHNQATRHLLDGQANDVMTVTPLWISGEEVSFWAQTAGSSGAPESPLGHLTLAQFVHKPDNVATSTTESGTTHEVGPNPIGIMGSFEVPATDTEYSIFMSYLIAHDEGSMVYVPPGSDRRLMGLMEVHYIYELPPDELVAEGASFVLTEAHSRIPGRDIQVMSNYSNSPTAGDGPCRTRHSAACIKPTSSSGSRPKLWMF